MTTKKTSERKKVGRPLAFFALSADGEDIEAIKNEKVFYALNVGNKDRKSLVALMEESPLLKVAEAAFKGGLPRELLHEFMTEYC